MFSKFWLVNVFLAAGVIFFAVRTHEVWFSGEDPLESEPLPAKEESAKEKQFVKPNLSSESIYRVFVDKNLFSEDRAEYLPPPPEAESGAETGQEPAPEIKPFEGFGQRVTLYGVFIYKEIKKALITNPDRKRGGAQDIWVEKGDVVLEVKQRDQVATLTVDDILEDRLLVKDGANRYEILLYDKENPKNRQTVAKDEEPKVVAPQAEVSNEAMVKERPKRGANHPRKQNEPQEAAAQTVENTEDPDSQYEIINTPFGEIKRRKK